MRLVDIRSYLYSHVPLYKKLGAFYYTHVHVLGRKLTNLSKRNRPTVLFYPDLPSATQVLYKVFSFLGYKVTNNPKASADVVIHYQDTTFRTPDENLKKLMESQYVVNASCNDISKKKVEKVFHEVFGYGLEVDPRTFNGPYVKKSNTNSAHDGTIITHTQEPQDRYIYQKVIDNHVKNDLIMDIRVPYIIDEIPFVYLKYRSKEKRFGGVSLFVERKKTDAVFSPREIENIMKFCQKMNLDFGELDVLRDAKDKTIYIVDMNNTPAGPPLKLPQEETQKALEIISEKLMSKIKKRDDRIH